MRTYQTTRGEQVQAKSKLQALKNLGYENIYWKGNTPYSVYQGLQWTNVYVITIK